MNERTVVIERVATDASAAPARHVSHEEHPTFKTVSLIARVVLGTVMLIAGAEKLGALEAFGANIYNYQILPVELVNLAALFFVWAEIAVGVMLVVGAAVRGSAFVSGILMLVFIVAIGSAMARGLKIDCGCFAGKASSQGATVSAANTPPTVGSPQNAVPGAPAEMVPSAEMAPKDELAPKDEPEKVGWPKLFEDIGLLALAVFLVYYPRSHLAVDTLLRREDSLR